MSFRKSYWPLQEWLVLLLICAFSIALSIFIVIYGRSRLDSWDGPIPPPSGSGRSNGGAGLETLAASTAGAVTGEIPAVEALS